MDRETGRPRGFCCIETQDMPRGGGGGGGRGGYGGGGGGDRW